MRWQRSGAIGGGGGSGKALERLTLRDAQGGVRVEVEAHGVSPAGAPVRGERATRAYTAAPEEAADPFADHRWKPGYLPITGQRGA